MKKLYPLFILLGLMFVFTFTDLRISQMLYQEGTVFGKIFEIIGESPYFIAGLISTTYLLVTATKRKSKILAILQGLVMLLLGLSVANHYTVNLNHHADLHMTDMTKIFLTVSLFLGFCFLSFYLSKKLDEKTMTRWALCGILMCLANYIIINVMKDNFGRMRFRDLIEMSDYTQWYVLNSNAINDSFRSFPSGHTAGAATIFWLLFLPKIRPTREVVLNVVVWFWILLTMISRVVEGAHFVTDTTMSIIIMYVTYLVLDKILYKNAVIKTS